MSTITIRAATLAAAAIPIASGWGCAGASSAVAYDPTVAHEAAECRDVAADASEDPLARGVIEVAPLRDPWTEYGPKEMRRLRGAEVVVAARPGMTAQWTRRWVDCRIHELASSSTGASDPSPLAVPGVRAQVAALRAGFAIRLRADDPSASEEILRRAIALR